MTLQKHSSHCQNSYECHFLRNFHEDVCTLILLIFFKTEFFVGGGKFLAVILNAIECFWVFCVVVGHKVRVHEVNTRFGGEARYGAAARNCHGTACYKHNENKVNTYS